MATYNSITTRDEASALMPEEVSREIIKHMPEQSAIMRMAKELPNMSRGQYRLPVLSVLPTAYFVTGGSQTARDYGLKQTTEQAWTNKYIYAEEVACIIPVPENVIADIDYDLWAEIQPSIEEAIGQVFDLAVLYGTNAPGTWPSDLVTGATAAGNTVALGTGVDLYEDILGESGIVAKVEADGYMVNGYLGHMAMRSKLRGVRATDGTLIFMPTMQGAAQYTLDGAPVDFPRNGSMDSSQALLIGGDWSQLVFSIRQDVTYKILTEAVIQDGSGNIVYNLAQQDMVALRVTFRAGWQLPNPPNRIQETEANRYPFGLLLPSS